MAKTRLARSHPHGELVLVEVAIEHLDLDELPEAHLLPETAGTMRRASWLAGRAALRLAAERAGVELPPIASDERGAPRLPEGMTGSISHKRLPSDVGEGRLIAAGLFSVNRSAGTIGVDVDALDPARIRIASKILAPDELAPWSNRPAAEQWPALLTAFSVKEAIYKALDPHVRRYVAFAEAKVRFGAIPEAPATRVEATLALARDSDGRFEVEAYAERWAVEGLVLSTARIRPRDRSM